MDMIFFVRPWFWVAIIMALLWLPIGLCELCDSSAGYQMIFALFLK